MLLYILLVLIILGIYHGVHAFIIWEEDRNWYHTPDFWIELGLAACCLSAIGATVTVMTLQSNINRFLGG